MSVKWGKKILPLEIDVNENVGVLKAQIYALTLIPADKQKILLPGNKAITDETDLLKLALRPGAKLMLIGTPEDKQAKMDLSAKPTFEEDLTSADKAKLYQQKTGVGTGSSMCVGGDTFGTDQPGEHVLHELVRAGAKKNQRAG